MVYMIQPSTLPPNELWSIEYSWKMAESITPEIPQIDEESDFLQVIIHAWSWDKNAMIQYARIQQEVGSDDILDDFIEKNAYQIVGLNGRYLQRPDIFNMKYSDFIIRLADRQYPLAARLAANGLLWSAGKTGLIYNPLTPENRVKLIEYTRYAIQGGYHLHSYLADYILFYTGFSYKDSNGRQLNPLSDRIPTLSKQELEESFHAYTISSLHGSQYAQIRLSEFYRYGISVNKSIEMAYAWSLIAKDNFIYFNKELSKKHFQERYKENTLNEYNQINLMSQLPQHMTASQIEKSISLAAQLKQRIVNVDYYTWEATIDTVPPMP